MVLCSNGRIRVTNQTLYAYTGFCVILNVTVYNYTRVRVLVYILERFVVSMTQSKSIV